MIDNDANERPSAYETLSFIMGFNAGLLSSSIYEKLSEEECINFTEKISEIYSTTVDKSKVLQGNIDRTQIDKAKERFIELIYREHDIYKKKKDR